VRDLILESLKVAKKKSEILVETLLTPTQEHDLILSQLNFFELDE
jgi:hypothetical protein